jgi:hypothetical protein
VWFAKPFSAEEASKIMRAKVMPVVKEYFAADHMREEG